MPRTTPEQVDTLHHLINEACNAATDIAQTLPIFGDVEEDDLDAEIAVRVRTTKALHVRDCLVALLASLTDDPS